MYMDYFFYLRTLPEGERISQILIISTILAGLLIIGIVLEIAKKKYVNKFKNFKKLLNKLNLFNKKETKKDV